MKISSVNLNRTTLNPPKNTNFKGEEKVQTTSKDDDEYVKVPKAEYKSNQWFKHLFYISLVADIIYLLLTQKPDPMEDVYRTFKQATKAS
ncbi:MAG: hypothetical protein PHC64_09035 [Candidatus Gastranaerophilales bacterium]|nr:hypothetical protein [Candidatus Gastranaerophilales bacterium]